MDDIRRENRLRRRAERLGFVINHHFATGYQVMVQTGPDRGNEDHWVSFPNDYSLDLEELEAVLKGAEDYKKRVEDYTGPYLVR